MIHHRLRGLQKGVAAPVVSDVFATSLYTGNGSTQTITNGIDLAGEGGLVWIKDRVTGDYHRLFDTLRGATKRIISNVDWAEGTEATSLTAFNANGFTLGDVQYTNRNGDTYVAWTFRQSPRFFDVVTYTGNGVSGRAVSHSLGVTPGLIVIKRLNLASDWFCTHRDLSAFGQHLFLNLTDAASSNVQWIANITSSQFKIYKTSDPNSLNNDGESYVAYLFAHDPDGVIQCGSYTGNGSTTGPTVTLGWEPQYLLIRCFDSSGNWIIYDNVRDTSNPRTYKLMANKPDEESTTGYDVDFTSTGFQIKVVDTDVNWNTRNYIYLAIKKET